MVSQAERHYREDGVRRQRGEMIVLINKLFKFLPVQTRKDIVDYVLTKKWTIETVLNLHRLPKPILYEQIGKMIWQRHKQ